MNARKENENLEKLIEHLQEMGKVALTFDVNIKELQKKLSEKGYDTIIESTDRVYLVLQNSLKSE